MAGGERRMTEPEPEIPSGSRLVTLEEGPSPEEAAADEAAEKAAHEAAVESPKVKKIIDGALADAGPLTPEQRAFLRAAIKQNPGKAHSIAAAVRDGNTAAGFKAKT